MPSLGYWKISYDDGDKEEFDILDIELAIILYYDYGKGDPKPCPQQVENLKAMDRKRVHPRKQKRKKTSKSSTSSSSSKSKSSKSKESPYSLPTRKKKGKTKHKNHSPPVTPLTSREEEDDDDDYGDDDEHDPEDSTTTSDHEKENDDSPVLTLTPSRRKFAPPREIQHTTTQPEIVSHPKRFVDLRVAKYFDVPVAETLYFGSIKQCQHENKSYNKFCLWYVLFDDGDEEWWDQTALTTGLKVYLKNKPLDPNPNPA